MLVVEFSSSWFPTSVRSSASVTAASESRVKFAADVLARHLEYDRPLASFHQIPIEDGKGMHRICLIVAVAKGSDVARVGDGQGHYTYPVRRETGIARESRFDAAKGKGHLKSDNHNFLRDLKQFIREA
jgi:hypothetical protein